MANVIYQDEVCYNGGLAEFPNSKKGILVLREEELNFESQEINFSIPILKIVGVELSTSPLKGWKALQLAFSNNPETMQRVAQESKDSIEITFLDKQSQENIASFSCLAFYIDSRERKAMKWKMHLLQFKPKFAGKQTSSLVDIPGTIEKLAKLKKLAREGDKIDPEILKLIETAEKQIALAETSNTIAELEKKLGESDKGKETPDEQSR
jgi:hypothetical protein